VILETGDLGLLRSFEDASLPEEDFDHEKHVHAAWCFLQQYGLQNGREKFIAALRRFVFTHGAADKYHETITRAFLDLIASRVSTRADWQSFRSGNRIIIEDGMSLLLRHYSSQVLFSDRARKAFVEPDIIPFPGPEADSAASDGEEIAGD
jgi:hypothetical protein